MSRRGSLTTSPVSVSRRTSLATITPNVANPVADSKVYRRGSLKDLAACRDLTNRASTEFQQQQQSSLGNFRRFLLNATVSELKSTIGNSELIIDINGGMRPIDAFNILLENNLEAAPVYQPNTHSHNADGSVVFTIDTLAPPSPSAGGSLSAAASPRHTRRASSTFGGNSYLSIRPDPISHGPSPAPSPRIVTPSRPTNHFAATPVSVSCDDSVRAVPSLSTPSTPSVLSVHSEESSFPRMMSRRRSSVSLREIGIAVDAPLEEDLVPCPRHCPHRRYLGFLDIRDYISSIVHVTNQRVNEDDIVFNDKGEPEAELHRVVGGLEGMVGVPQEEEEYRPMNVLASMKEEDEENPTKPNSTPEFVEIEEKKAELPVVKQDVEKSSPTTLTGGAHGSLEILSQQWEEAIKEGMRRLRVGGNITVSYLSRRHPCRSVLKSSSMFEVCEMLRRGAHRIVVTDNEGRILDVISQRAVVLWLHEAMTRGEGKRYGESKLGDVNIGVTHVITVKSNAPVREALQIIDSSGKSGIAVVDENGRLVGATSTRLLKAIIGPRDNGVFAKPIKDVMKATDSTLNISAASEHVMVDAGAVVMLEGEASVFDALTAMVTHNTNRIFTVDEEGFPARVVTLGDILNGLVQC